MAELVVLGAGLSGTLMAYELLPKLRKDVDRLTVIGQGTRYHFVPSNPWVAIGWREKQDIEVDLEHDEILIFRLTGELGEDGILRPAGRTPHGEDIYEDRLPVFLRLGEGGGVERLPFGRPGRKRAEQCD